MAAVPAVPVVALALAALVAEPLAERHRRFVEAEAHFLLSSEESARFDALETSEERDLFVASFWRRRDPTPGTLRNEAREAHAARLADSDRLFGDVGRRGRLSERGRLYQLLGPPSFRETFAFAEHRLAPVELWHYTAVTASFLPESFHVVFFRPGGQGPFRLWSPEADGPAALLREARPRGDLDDIARFDPELATVVLQGLVPGGPVRSVELLADLRALPDLAARELETKARARAEAGFARLRTSLEAAVFLDEAGVPELHYALALHPGQRERLRWADGERGARARLVLLGRLLGGGRELDRWEDEIRLETSRDDLADLDELQLSFQGRRVLPEGASRIEISLASPGRALGVRSRALSRDPLLVVPRAPRLETAVYERMPFHVHGRLVLPGPVPAGSVATAVAPAPTGSLTWELLRGEELLWSASEDRPASGELLLKALPTETLPAGDYRLRAAGAAGVLETTFRIGAAVETRVLAREPEASDEARYRAARARALVRAGRRERAVDEMALAVAAAPGSLDLQLELAVLRFAEGRCPQILDQLGPLARDASEPDVHVLLAACSEKLGRSERAVEHYERALELAPGDEGIRSALERLRRNN